jgi:hypothetical protein
MKDLNIFDSMICCIGGRIMQRNILGIGLVLLFMVSAFTPMTLGYDLIKYPSILNEGNNLFKSGSGIPPVANFTIFNDSYRGVVEFDGSLSYDPDGIIISYEWDYGDGTSDNGGYYGWYSYHQYCGCDITYNVTLTVTDNEGLKGNLTKNLYVIWANYPPPLIDIYGPTSGDVGTEYEYKFRAMYPEEIWVFLQIEWGDGNSTGWIGPYPWITYDFVTLSHTWSKKGTYIIKARGKDFCSEFPPSYFEVTITKNKAIDSNSLFLKLLERLPLLQKVIYLIK